MNRAISCSCIGVRCKGITKFSVRTVSYLKIHYLQPVFTVCLSGYRSRKYRRNFPIDQILQFLQMTVPPDALPQGIC